MTNPKQKETAMRLHFNIEEVKKILDHSKNSPEHQALWGQEETAKAEEEDRVLYLLGISWP